MIFIIFYQDNKIYEDKDVSSIFFMDKCLNDNTNNNNNTEPEEEKIGFSNKTIDDQAKSKAIQFSYNIDKIISKSRLSLVYQVEIYGFKVFT